MNHCSSTQTWRLSKLNDGRAVHGTCGKAMRLITTMETLTAEVTERKAMNCKAP